MIITLSSAHTAADRLDQRGVGEAHTVGQLEHIQRHLLGRHADVLGHTGWVEPGALEGRAERLVAAPAVPALQAGHVVVHEHAVAGREAGHARADLGHCANRLVADKQWRTRAHVPFHHIAGAHAAGRHAHQQLTWPSARLWQLHHAHIVVAVAEHNQVILIDQGLDCHSGFDERLTRRCPSIETIGPCADDMIRSGR